MAFTPLLPDVTLYNPSPLAGQVLHLPFEDQPDETGTPLFRDLSGLNHDGICGTLSTSPPYGAYYYPQVTCGQL